MKKKTFKLPHTLVLIYSLLILAYILTWIIPSGNFKRVEKKVGNSVKKIAQPGTYQKVKKTYISPVNLVTAPVKGFNEGALIISFLFMIGGAFEIIDKTGTINLAIKKMALFFGSKPKLQFALIPLLMIIFSLGGSVFGMAEETIPFIPIFIPLAISMGYDTMVGIAIPFLGAAAGFAAAFFNPFTVGIAQGLSGLPLYSGLTYRLVVWAVGTFTVIAFVMLYALKIKKNPKLSLSFEKDKEIRENLKLIKDKDLKWKIKDSMVLSVFIGGLIVLVWGILVKEWYIEAIAAVFLSMGVFSGLISSMNVNDIAKNFINGAKGMMNVAFVIACGRAVLIICLDGNILDSILFYASQMISVFPKAVTAQIMFLVQCFINFFIHSGTAQASLTMPVMSPLSDLIGISRQTMVLAFQLCEFIVPILPTSAVTMGVLAMAGISWEKWAKWFLPLMIILILLCFILLIPPTLFFTYGPL